MSYWDTEKQKIIISFTKKSVENYPGWEIEDCGCCNGLKWGGDYPTECQFCKGGGVVFYHKQSGVMAMYPGGAFLGKRAQKEK